MSRYHHRAIIFLTPIVLFTALTPAFADGLTGVFHPAIGFPVTIAVGVLEGALLNRFVRAPHPYRESIIANCLSAIAGMTLILFMTFRDFWLIPGHTYQGTITDDMLFLLEIFFLTLLIEYVYLYLRWKKHGATRIAGGVLVANVVSYVGLVPLAMLLNQWYW